VTGHREVVEEGRRDQQRPDADHRLDGGQNAETDMQHRSVAGCGTLTARHRYSFSAAEPRFMRVADVGLRLSHRLWLVFDAASPPGLLF
jgi:hypothetical protein